MESKRSMMVVAFCVNASELNQVTVVAATPAGDVALAVPCAPAALVCIYFRACTDART
jgi:hypothetical protein